MAMCKALSLNRIGGERVNENNTKPKRKPTVIHRGRPAHRSLLLSGYSCIAQNSSDNLPCYLTQTTVVAQMLAVEREGRILTNLIIFALF